MSLQQYFNQDLYKDIGVAAISCTICIAAVLIIFCVLVNGLPKKVVRAFKDEEIKKKTLAMQKEREDSWKRFQLSEQRRMIREHTEYPEPNSLTLKRFNARMEPLEKKHPEISLQPMPTSTKTKIRAEELEENDAKLTGTKKKVSYRPNLDDIEASTIDDSISNDSINSETTDMS